TKELLLCFCYEDLHRHTTINPPFSSRFPETLTFHFDTYFTFFNTTLLINMASSQHYQQYEVLTHVNENTMTTRPMRVSRNRENLQPYWIPEGFRAVLISINDIQRLPLQQATQDLQQRQNENTTHHVIRRRYANHN